MGLEANNPLNTPSQELAARRKEDVKAVYDMIDARMDWSTSHAGDLGKITNADVKTAYYQKAQELQKECEKLGVDLGLKVQEAVSTALRQRFDLMLQLAGGQGGNLDTNKELMDLRQQGLAIIQNYDVQSLVYDYLNTADPQKAAEYLKTIHEGLTPDTYNILHNKARGLPLEEKDWIVVVDIMHKLTDKNASKADRDVGMALIANLSFGERMELLGHMQDDPTLPKVLGDMVDSTYLRVDQATVFLESKLTSLKTNPKTDPKELAAWEALATRVASPETQRRQEKMEEIRQKMPDRIAAMQFGQHSAAGDLLTFRGAAGIFGMLNGAATAALAIGMDFKEPWLIPTNPMLYAGIAEMGIGLQATKGLGHLVSTPLELGARLTEDKKTEAVQETEMKRQAFFRELGRYPLEAQFYYNFADKITEAYNKKGAAEHTTHPQLTLKDLGVDWDKLPEKYKSIAPAEYEKRISDWAADMAQDFKLKLPSTDENMGQKWFMNESRRTAELPPYTDDEQLQKLRKLIA